MDLDQLAMVVDPDEAGIAADLDALAQVARGHGVQRVAELDVMIGMDGGLRPRRAIKGRGRERQERRLLHRLEHDARDLARGAVHAGAGDVAAPADGARLHLGQVAEGLAAEEILAAVGNPALHFRFSRRVADDGGVDDEAPVLRVLEKHAVDPGRVAIGAGDDGLEIVLDEALDHAAEEHPGALQAVEDGREILAQGDGQKRVAAEAERDEQAVHAAAPLRDQDRATARAGRSRPRPPRPAGARPRGRSWRGRRSPGGPARSDAGSCTAR